MKPHPRIRKTITWGGAAVTALLVVAWLGSAVREVRVHHPRVWANLENGRASVFVPSEEFRRFIAASPPQHGLITFPVSSPGGLRWWFERETKVAGTTVAIPLWSAVLASLAPTVLMWRLDTLAHRREKLNLCPTPGCGYDRTGLATGAVCPECGRTPDTRV